MPIIRTLTVALGFSLGLVTAGLAQFAPVEPIEIPSTNFSDQQFLLGQAASGAPVTLKGTLKVPTSSGRHPLVLLLHGSDGVDSNSVNAWRWTLSDLGYATLRLDSFGARGVSQINNDQGAVSQFAQIYDAYRVTELISRDARFDPDKIVVMGFSRGGTAALFATLKRFHDLYGPKTGRIAAYVALFPACNFELKGDTELVDAPLREFHGAADDWTSPAVCQAYIDRLKTAGADAQMTQYPSARHAFDTSLAKAVVKLDDAQSSFGCMRRESDDGVLLNDATGKPFSYSDACVSLGPTVQYNEAATKAAQAAVAALLSDVVGKP